VVSSSNMTFGDVTWEMGKITTVGDELMVRGAERREGQSGLIASAADLTWDRLQNSRALQ
jgi:hypothetical protein